MKTKTLSLLFVSFVFTVLTNSCREETTPIQSQYTLVLFDFSLSQDSTDFNQMTDLLLEIHENQPNTMNCELAVMIIDRGNTNRIYNQTLDALPQNPILKQKQKRKNELESQNDSLKKLITAKYDSIDTKENCKKESCICNSLENAVRTLKDKTADKIQLVILSDMLEDCDNDNTPFKGDLNFCNVKNKALFLEQTLKKLEESYTPDDDELLSNYVAPENLYFIFSGLKSDNIELNRCLEISQIEQFWEAYLFKLGYQKDEVNTKDGVVFTFNELPERLKSH